MGVSGFTVETVKGKNEWGKSHRGILPIIREQGCKHQATSHKTGMLQPGNICPYHEGCEGVLQVQEGAGRWA